MPTPGTPPDPARLSTAFVELSRVIGRLRAPDGCPWDREQTLKSIQPYTLEETYELLEAIDADDTPGIQEELGDVLLQVVLDAQIAADEGRFTLIEVIEGITRKMISRHPHVFGEAQASSAAEVRAHWERIKAAEKQRQSLLDGIPLELPALARAARITKKAASVGYDFPHRAMLFDKLREELEELRQELDPDQQLPELSAAVDIAPVPDLPVTDPDQRERIEGELGDVLFVLANIARRWGIQPEDALRRSNAKFARRFRFIETGLKQADKSLQSASLQEMEDLYQQCKREERSPPEAAGPHSA